MSEISTYVLRLMALGVPAEEAACIAAEIFAAGLASAPQHTRTARQDRNARYYAAWKGRLKASESVLKRLNSDVQDAQASETVLKRLNPDAGVTKEKSPHTPLQENTTPSNPPKPSKAIKANLDEAFERFWRAYPRREGPNPKKPARLEFVSAVNRGADPEAIIAGAERLASLWRGRPESDLRFVSHARKWLRDETWQDDAPAPAQPRQARDTLPADADLLIKFVEKHRQTGSWPATFGPPPDDPATLVPEALRHPQRLQVSAHG